MIPAALLPLERHANLVDLARRGRRLIVEGPFSRRADAPMTSITGTLTHRRAMAIKDVNGTTLGVTTHTRRHTTTMKVIIDNTTGARTHTRRHVMTITDVTADTRVTFTAMSDMGTFPATNTRITASTVGNPIMTASTASMEDR